MRKLILSAALVAASVFGMTAVQAAEPVAGKEYIELSNPVPVSVPGKIDRSRRAVLVRLPTLLPLRADHQPLG